jgi:hypothetical protein
LGISRERVDIFGLAKTKTQVAVTRIWRSPVFGPNYNRFLNFSPGNGTDFENAITFFKPKNEPFFWSQKIAFGLIHF